MAAIELEVGTVQIDDEDLERLGGRSVYIGSNGYAYFSTWADGPVTIHSFVMGGAVAGMHIDHINGDRLDNRRSNLRVVSAQTNQVNRKSLSRNNTSGHRGVIVRKGKPNPFIAQITVMRRNVYLGSFPDMDSAVAARRAAEIRFYGEECP